MLFCETDMKPFWIVSAGIWNPVVVSSCPGLYPSILFSPVAKMPNASLLEGIWNCWCCSNSFLSQHVLIPPRLEQLLKSCAVTLIVWTTLYPVITGSSRRRVKTDSCLLLVLISKQYSNDVTIPGQLSCSSSGQLYMNRLCSCMNSGVPVPCSATLG